MTTDAEYIADWHAKRLAHHRERADEIAAMLGIDPAAVRLHGERPGHAARMPRFAPTGDVLPFPTPEPPLTLRARFYRWVRTPWEPTTLGGRGR